MHFTAYMSENYSANVQNDLLHMRIWSSDQIKKIHRSSKLTDLLLKLSVENVWVAASRLQPALTIGFTS